MEPFLQGCPLVVMSLPKVLLSTAYLAPVSYYACLLHSRQVLVEQHEHYHKQSYRNRCTIVAANGTMDLSIPVKALNDQPVREVQIDYSKPWQRRHWLSLEAAYRSTPFFEYCQDDLKPFFQRDDIRLLFDFNAALQDRICSLLGFAPKLCYTDTYRLPQEKEVLTEDVLDWREAIHPKKELPAALSSHYCSPRYMQVFEPQVPFVADASIVDLLFNEGPEALRLLHDSVPPQAACPLK